MFSTIASGIIRGVRCIITHVEVDTSQGLPCFEMVGYLGSEVREAKERVKVALKNAGIVIPPIRIIVNLSPADIRKEGTAFDLPIAVGILLSLGYLQETNTADTLFIGELGLNGEIKAVKGVLPIVIKAKEEGYKRCIVPEENAIEGAVINGIEVIGVSCLNQVIHFLKTERPLQAMEIPPTKVDVEELFRCGAKHPELDFADLNGQETARRAAEIAAAGFHHLLLIGPPGAGKTMIAKRIPGILPPLTLEESLEVSAIYSVSGLLNQSQSLITKRPFLNPHHTISQQALTGGGRVPRPGIISLAHRAVLFLDELPEFKRQTLDLLRQPLEDKYIQIARSYGTYEYPADFMLIAAMNPCVCGYYPDWNRCTCTPSQVQKYLGRISGPILDRIDMSVEVAAVGIRQLQHTKSNESSAQIRERVMQARERQERRYVNTSYRFNGDLRGKDIGAFCPLGEKEQKMMEQVFQTMRLSARAYHRILKVARTIADLEGAEVIQEIHLSEAVCYRMADEKYWGA